ncbi:MAG: M1 family metallopeptidase [Armatimonadetes bacterium]|nr:M1 family metallopeptidase [Armatimonadota bacterium]
MNRFLLLLAAFGLIGSVAFAKTETTCGTAEHMKRLFAAGMLPNGVPKKSLEAVDDTDILDVDLDLEAVPSTKVISGTVTYLLRSNVNGLAAFTFRLDPAYTISSLKLDGRNITKTSLNSITWRANFDTTFNSGQDCTVAITYSGVAPTASGFGSINLGTRTGTAQYWETLSEPYYAYTWWPSKESNKDKFTATIKITVPNPMVAASNGVLQSTTPLSGARTKFTWRTTYPITTYLVSIGATNYNTWTSNWTYGATTMPVMFYIWPEQDNAGNRAAAEVTLQQLTTHSNTWGAYPFIGEKYGIYQFTFGGGMEHQTMTGQINFSEGLSSHELGHQWWGDNVTCKNWEDIWLNEGFATYCEATWLQYKPGSTGFPALQAAMAARKPTAYSQAAYRTDTSSVNSLFASNYAYRKGGWALHMLRRVMGETKFFQGMAAYRNAYQGSAADTDEFRQQMEIAYGGDLTWFFNEWVMSPGAAAYTNGTSTVVVNGKTYLLVSLTQSQSASYPKYKMPLDFSYTDGSTAKTTVLQGLAAAQQWFAIPLTGTTASAFTLDPNGWVLTTTNNSGAYVAGPAKIVEVVPGGRRTPETIQLYFSNTVNCTKSQFSVSSAGISVPFNFAYDAATKRVTLRITGRVTNWKDVTITAFDTISDTVSGKNIDGEVGTALPSGDGLAGGNFVYRLN